MRQHAPTQLPVNDSRRIPIRRAIFATLYAVTIFCVFTATKEVKPIYNHAPWLNDPYDTVISFTMYFVPFVTAVLMIQVSLCLKSRPLLIPRVVRILRACRLAVGAMLVEVLSAWLSVILGANKSQWSPGVTGVEIGLLLTTSFVASVAGARLLRTPQFLRSTAYGVAPDEPDWIGDAIAVAKRETRWLGSLRPMALRLFVWSDRILLTEVRRRPVTFSAAASAAFGIAVGGWQGLREGYQPLGTLASMALVFCGMFAFILPAGSYLGLVRSANPSSGLRRRSLDASVIASGSAIVALAFRGNLWGLVATNSNAAGPAQFAVLEGGAVLVTFVLALVVESAARVHSGIVR